MYLALVLSAEMLSIDSVARWFEDDMTMGDFQKTPNILDVIWSHCTCGKLVWARAYIDARFRHRQQHAMPWRGASVLGGLPRRKSYSVLTLTRSRRDCVFVKSIHLTSYHPYWRRQSFCAKSVLQGLSWIDLWISEDFFVKLLETGEQSLIYLYLFDGKDVFWFLID